MTDQPEQIGADMVEMTVTVIPRRKATVKQVLDRTDAALRTALADLLDYNGDLDVDVDTSAGNERDPYDELGMPPTDHPLGSALGLSRPQTIRDAAEGLALAVTITPEGDTVDELDQPLSVSDAFERTYGSEGVVIKDYAVEDGQRLIVAGRDVEAVRKTFGDRRAVIIAGRQQL